MVDDTIYTDEGAIPYGVQFDREWRIFGESLEKLFHPENPRINDRTNLKGRFRECLHCGKTPPSKHSTAPLPHGWRRVPLFRYDTKFFLIECDECSYLWDNEPRCEIIWNDYMDKVGAA